MAKKEKKVKEVKKDGFDSAALADRIDLLEADFSDLSIELSFLSEELEAIKEEFEQLSKGK